MQCNQILGLMVLCLVRFGGLDKEPLQFSTDLGDDDYGAEAVGVVAAFSMPTVSWYASLIPAGLTYLLLMRYWKGCQRFTQ